MNRPFFFPFFVYDKGVHFYIYFYKEANVRNINFLVIYLYCIY